jgi:hypothetical protein
LYLYPVFTDSWGDVSTAVEVELDVASVVGEFDSGEF